MPNQPQTIALWEDLKRLTSNVVEEMNRAADLRGRTGGLECRFADGETILVSKNSCPQMCVTIHSRAEAVDVDSRLVLGGPDEIEREFHESLTISGASLRSAAGDVLTIDQAVYHILRPFLHIGTVGC